MRHAGTPPWGTASALRGEVEESATQAQALAGANAFPSAAVRAGVDGQRPAGGGAVRALCHSVCALPVKGGGGQGGLGMQGSASPLHSCWTKQLQGITSLHSCN